MVVSRDRCYRNINYLFEECTMLTMTLVKKLAPKEKLAPREKSVLHMHINAACASQSGYRQLVQALI